MLAHLSRLCVILGLLLPAAGVRAWDVPGAWRAARGDAGERTVAAVVTGGDGALYAIGSGSVERRAPDGPFVPIGRYAPELRWDEDQAIEATGPFDSAYLDRVAEEALRAIEAAGTEEIDVESTSEDVVGLLLRNYVEDPDTDGDSPYRVVATASAAGGAWVATGAGLFRLTAKGVGGPVGPPLKIQDLATARGVLWIAAADGLYTVGADAAFVRRRPGPVERVAAGPGGMAFLTEGDLWLWPDGGQPIRTTLPTGRPERIAADEGGLWVATGLALYRQEGAGWRLCPAIADSLTALVPVSGGRLVAVGESALHLTDAACKSVVRQEAPWPGGARLFGATEQGAALWLATANGLHELVTRDHNAADSARVDAFRRAVRALPSLDTLTRQALLYNQLDRAATAYGVRPVLRGLLPDFMVRYQTFGRRLDALPSLFGGDRQLSIEPWTPQWTVMLQWTVNFDILSVLFDVEREASMGAVTADELADGLTDEDVVDPGENLAAENVDVEFETEGLAPEGSLDPDLDTEGFDRFGDTLDGFDGLDGFDDGADPGLDTVADDRAFSMLAVERRQAQRDRQVLADRLARLYRERVHLMFKLWVELPLSGLYLVEVMRIDEIDAEFDVATGGAFSRALR